MPTFSPRQLLQTIGEHGVECVVVGMGAAVLQGAAAQTLDLDVVHARTEANVRRILECLRIWNARYRGDPRGLVPSESHLLGPGHQLLETDLGPIDFLGALGSSNRPDDYQTLLPRSLVLDVGGFSVRVLGLESVIELKRAAGRPKDLAMLPLLEATLRRRG